MGFTFFLFMVLLDLVAIAQAQNCSKPVLGANMHLMGEDILLTSFPDGRLVSLACDVGYMSAGGSSKMTCTAGGWSPVKMKCERKDCGNAGEVEYGDIDYSGGTEFGAKISVNCNTGYLLVGKGTLLCGDKGWMGRLPRCEVRACDPPAAIMYGAFTPIKDSFKYLDAVQYSCLGDYTLRGPPVSSCSADGNFKPDPPTCVMVQCEDLEIANGYHDAGSRPPHKYKASLKFRCNPGYLMSGEATLICGINSNWSSKAPECKLSPPTKTTAIPATTSTTSTTSTTTPLGRETDAPRPTDAAESGDNFLKWFIPILVLEQLLSELEASTITTCNITIDSLEKPVIGIGAAAFGVWTFMKKKRGSQRPSSDNDAAKNEEAMPLS